jgi:hypothetical protein
MTLVVATEDGLKLRRACSNQRSSACDLRTQVRLRKSLIDQRSGWIRRVRAQCFHHGLADPPNVQTAAGLAWLARAELPAVAREVVAVALTMIEAIDVHIHALEAELCAVARHQKGCLALQSQWGVGPAERGGAGGRAGRRHSLILVP